MGLWLRMLTALSEDLGLVPSTYMDTLDHLQLQFRVLQAPGTYAVYIQAKYTHKSTSLKKN